MKRLIYNTKIIDEYLNKNNLTKKEFCKICNVSENVLRSIYKGKNVKINNFFKIFRQLGMPQDFIIALIKK